jgi:hypothetical protein
MIIGSLNRGDISAAAYTCAREVMDALIRGNREAPVLSAVNSGDREKIFSDLGKIEPRKFRLGEGREEADGAVSFLVRFMGRERGIVGELYVRSTLVELEEVEPEEAGPEEEETEEEEEAPVVVQRQAVWRLDDLILEEERRLDEVIEDRSFDLPPYERFF